MRTAARIGGVLALSLILVGAGAPLVDALRANPQAAAFFASALAARDAAQAADAYLYASAPWQRGEGELAAAASAFERGDREAAQARAERAVELFQGAGQAAFAASLLAEPRATLGQARKARAGRYAPRTTARAEALVVEAEAALAAGPGEREHASALAAAATTEARRALGLGTQLADAATAEQAVIDWQDALAQVAHSAGVEQPIDVAPAAGAAAVVAAIERERATREELERDLAERNAQIRGLQGESSALASQLDGVSRERVELARQLETQAAARERLASVENRFGPDEAEVLRERDDIVIRLLGLKFPPGSSKLGRGQEALLDEVIEAIGLYSDRDAVVEGHTDAAGSTDANLELSRARARSVRDYLIASGRMPAARVTSEGYGETRPVASNDSDEGRARNRRIDVRLRSLEAR